jgi:general nucleoside transport system permease protein
MSTGVELRSDDTSPVVSEIPGAPMKARRTFEMAMRWELRRTPEATRAAAMAWRLVAIVMSLLVASIVLVSIGDDPLAMSASVLSSTFGTTDGWQDLGLLFSPLLLTGLAVAICLRMGIWNIGADGQFYMGAWAATAVGLSMKGSSLLVLPLMFLAGAIAGALWILVPALARIYGQVNEIITTLLLNFVAALLVYYFAIGPWRDRGAAVISATPRVPYDLPNLFASLHCGALIGIILAGVAAIIYRYTRWGYEIDFCGANPEAARYAGVPIVRRMLAVMLVSGGLAGVAGMIELAGTVHRLQGGISNQYGYLGVVIAVLVNGSPLGVIWSALLFALLLQAGVVLQTQGLSVNAIVALTGLILLFAALGEVASRIRLIRRPT